MAGGVLHRRPGTSVGLLGLLRLALLYAGLKLARLDKRMRNL